MHLNLKLSILFLAFHLVSCNYQPQEIKIGKDNCSFCKMTISNVRFGVEAITKKGKIFKYDEVHCLLGAINEGELVKNSIREIYLSDFCGNHQLIKSSNSFLLSSEELKSPMGGNIAVFSSKDSLLAMMQKVKGQQVVWSELFR